MLEEWPASKSYKLAVQRDKEQAYHCLWEKAEYLLILNRGETNSEVLP